VGIDGPVSSFWSDLSESLVVGEMPNDFPTSACQIIQSARGNHQEIYQSCTRIELRQQLVQAHNVVSW